MARYVIKLKSIVETEIYVEADSVEIAVYRSENEDIREFVKPTEVISKEAIGVSLVEETVTEQELPSSD
jgi:hypothetical protein